MLIESDEIVSHVPAYNKSVRQERPRESDGTGWSTKAPDHDSTRGCHLVDAQQGGVEVYLRGEGTVIAQHPTELIQSDLAPTGNVSQVSSGFTTGI